MTSPDTFLLPRESQREVRRGPLGGNLDDPQNHPAWRESEFKGVPQPDGSIGLHRLEHENTAVPGHKNEQPWHRMAAFMLLAGRTNSEIALAAQKTVSGVCQLRAQLWFQQLLATLGNEQGEAINGLLQSEALASIEKIVELRSNQNPRVALAAANILLEQAHGKAVQKIVSEVSHRSFSDPADELASIQADLANIRQARAGVARIEVPHSANNDVIDAEFTTPSTPAASSDSACETTKSSSLSLSQDADATPAPSSVVSRTEPTGTA